jgi:TonB family protein
MNPELWFPNLLAYSLQVAIISALAAILLRTFPLRSPEVTLAWLQSLLGACLVLPAVEPWTLPAYSPVTGVTATVVGISAAGATHPSDRAMLIAVVLAGIAARLVWLAVGCARLFRYSRRAQLLDARQSGIGQWPWARAACPRVSVSSEVAGPVTFGFLRPAILLPARWLNLGPVQRDAVVCHEFLHVRRKDWLFHMAEEVIRALLWFHPAIWWLTGEIRLVREQVVDRQVARLTGSTRSYVEVLLVFAGVDSSGTAPAFTPRRHLARRIKSLLEEVSMTKSCSLASLTGITLCLAAAGAVAVWSFPLQSVRSTFITQDDSSPAGGVVGIAGDVIQGVPGGVSGGVIGGVAGGVVGGVPGMQTVAAGPQDQTLHKTSEPGVTGPKLLHKVDPNYTKHAKHAKIEGTVVLSVVVRPDGRAHDMVVMRSLDAGLDKKALDAVKQWVFEPAKKSGKPVAMQATIEVNFRLR